MPAETAMDNGLHRIESSQEQAHTTDPASKNQQSSMSQVDEASVFSFRKKKQVPRVSNSKAPLAILSSPTRHSLDESSSLALNDLNRHEPVPHAATSSQPKSVQEPIKEQNHDAATQDRALDSGRARDFPRWDVVWAGSIIVPTLVPVAVSTNTSSLSAVPFKKPATPLKKASLDTRKQAFFEGRDGIRLQPTVTEYPGIAFALPRSTGDARTGQEKTIIRTDIDMHYIAKVDLSSFPRFLLAPGCDEPCQVFVKPEARKSSLFFQELVDRDDINEVESRATDGSASLEGRIGFLLKVATKPGIVSKKKSAFSGQLRRNENPFLEPSPAGTSSSLSRESSDEKAEEEQKKLFQESSMFLLYSRVRADDGQELKEPNNIPQKRFGTTVSFHAYPLADQSLLSDRILWNHRTIEAVHESMDTLQQEVEHMQYEDSTVDDIMNGDLGDDHPYDADFSMDVSEDESLWSESILLEALERNRAWSPYVVIPTTKTSTSISSGLQGSADILKGRTLVRSQTLDTASLLNKDRSVEQATANTWSRHQSSDGALGIQQPIEDTALRNSSGRKGLSRLKSPSRAPQHIVQPRAEMRRKLGVGSTRKPVIHKEERSSLLSSVHIGLKSPSKRKSVGSFQRDLLGRQVQAPTEITMDLTTLLKPRKPNKDTADGLNESVNSPPLHSGSISHQPPAAKRRSSTTGSSGTSQGFGGVTVAGTNEHMEEEQNQPSKPALSKTKSSSKLSASSRDGQDVGSTNRGPRKATTIEIANKETIKTLVKPTLKRINIGTNHEDYKECASNLYRSVKFALQRKDLATRMYSLEELERIMDRHADVL